MAFGEYRDENDANLGDTITLVAAIYNADRLPYTEDDFLDVTFTVRKPDGTQTVEIGEILEDGTGSLLYSETSLIGSYIAMAKFTFDTGEIRSTRVDFEVVDPFGSVVTPEQQIANAVWSKLEDCFDSEEGGPWLRDVTKRFFGKQKIPALIPEGLLLINLAPPMTDVTLGDFTLITTTAPVDTDQMVLVEAVFLATVRHLMRSYVEQPLPTGAQVVYEDRRDYLDRWGTIYQMETEYFNRILALYKRQFLGLGKTSLLLGSKAGRLIGAPMRSRQAGRGWGY